MQGRREPNVGPGPAQIWRISGFVNSKTDGENAAVLSELLFDLQKKKKVFRPHMLISQCHFDGPLSNPWAPGSLYPLPPSRWPCGYDLIRTNVATFLAREIFSFAAPICRSTHPTSSLLAITSQQHSIITIWVESWIHITLEGFTECNITNTVITGCAARLIRKRSWMCSFGYLCNGES